MTRIFLCATVITQGWNKYWNNSQCRKLALERKKILAASARTWSSNLLIVNLVLHTIELSLFPTPDTSLWRYITIPHLVTKGSAVPKISSGQTLFHLFCFFVNCCDFDLEHSNPILSLKTLAIKFIYLSYLPSKYTSGCQKIVRRYIVETVIFWWYKPSLSDLALEIATVLFHTTFCLVIMMHHHTKFGCNRLRGSENISWANPGKMDMGDSNTPRYNDAQHNTMQLKQCTCPPGNRSSVTPLLSVNTTTVVQLYLTSVA